MTSVDLSVEYLGKRLGCPLVAGASPMTHELDFARRLEDAGVGAIVMHSLFEEQIELDEMSHHHHTASHEYSHAEALSYFPEPDQYISVPDRYLEQIALLKKAVDVPVIASLNGITEGGWVEYAKLMEEAGADALELNVYYVAIDPEETASAVEQRYVDVLEAVKSAVTFPVAMKLSPFFSAPVQMARRLDAAGADALVLFNRFYQPDIDIDTFELNPAVRYSSSGTLLLRLRWLAALHARVGCSLGATGGVHTGRDALKALMAGATVAQMTSALLEHGPAHVETVRTALAEWLDDNDYESVGQLVGSMSLERCPDPAHLERGHYMRVLRSWHHED